MAHPYALCFVRVTNLKVIPRNTKDRHRLRRMVWLSSLAFYACGGRVGGASNQFLIDGAAASELSDTGESHAEAALDGGPPSCAVDARGISDCGDAQESCCTSMEVVGGTFFRSYLSDGGVPAVEANPATVDTLRLDKYDVTVARFRQFVDAFDTGWRPSAGAGKHSHLNGGLGLVNSSTLGGYEGGWDTSYNMKVDPNDTTLVCDDNAPNPIVDDNYFTWARVGGVRDTLPINCVNWYEAYAFCIWDGGFLPSETEWEYAAAGGTQQRLYPWGAAPAVIDYAIFDCVFPSGLPDMSSCVSSANIAPVGTATLGAGLWGQLDLAGNLWQWTLDWAAPYVDPCVNCAYLNPEGAWAVRGGSFQSPPEVLVSTYRMVPVAGEYGLARSYQTGFRCARAPL
jgi:formylglycine-generating enzyme